MALGRDRSVVSKWESGQVDVDLEIAGKVAKHYGVSLTEVLEIEGAAIGGSPYPTGFAEDLVPFIFSGSDPFPGVTLNEHQYRFTVTSDALANIGILKGDVVIVDDSAQAVAQLKPLQAVQVNFSDPTDGRSKLLLRQFVPPRLLITNGSVNMPMLDMEKDGARIMAVIVTALRSFRSN